ncbi:fl(2)d-associated complex component [Eupeodes corollae]|uniref:fl(2)d-associated complex component n=1 Tax=Eupeodes corollae TaxID=290404 RepID=UPI0024919D4B|nr:fl(2)d-associated complex component [Eupeodes corollae]
MDKKSKEALRRYKKARVAQSSSDSSSSSDSDSGSSSGSYSSSSSEKKPGHRKKKGRDSSTSGDERRKRDKGHSCHQKKLEAKRNHLKRKLREAKAAKKRALGTNAVRRRAGSTSPNKIKVPGEKKHVRTDSKERLRHAAEREKMRARERDRIRSRSPRTLAKLEAKMRARKSPVPPVSRHQMSPREKIIIQTRTRERTPERKRDLKIRLDDSRERERRDRERAEREAERQKEREEALARCQERQRERERLAREKLRREKEKEYAERGGDRLIPRPAEREMALAQARGYGSRERSLEDEGRIRHGHASRIRDPAYEREREYLAADHHRVPVLERDERRDRDYMVIRRREVLSPGHYRDDRDLYSEEERAAYVRAYAEEERRRDPRWDPRELDLLSDRELEKLYPPVRRGGEDWPEEERWDDKNWGRGKSNRPSSEPDWDAEEFPGGSRQLWEEAREKRERERALDHVQSPSSGRSGRWPQQDWRGGHAQPGESGSSHRKGANYRHGGGPQMDYLHDRQKFRPHPPPLMAIHSGYHPPTRQFPSKRQMTYTNPNLKKKLGGPTTPGGTAIPSLLALPLIPPPTISELVAAEKEQQPLLMEVNQPVPTLIVPSSDEASKTTEEAEKTDPEVKAASEGANEEEKSQEPEEEGALPETPTETEPVIAKENEPSEVAPNLEPAAEQAPAAVAATDEHPVESEPVPDDLSEISDSDDEILDKLEESKPAIETAAGETNGDVNAENQLTGSPMKDGVNEDSKPEAIDDDLLDFEEISDGELEEDSRTKGVGDALGVDWASLVKEAKVPTLAQSERTTAKEKWQAHRIILDVGISLKMAGEEFGKRILTEAKEKLDMELGETKPIKMEIKEESTEDTPTEDVEDVKNKIKLENGTAEVNEGQDFDVDRLNPLAFVQVGERVKRAEKRALIIGACGPNSRALSARYDLKLRRRLCGLPTLECDFRRPASEKIKSIAMALFQRTMEVK